MVWCLHGKLRDARYTDHNAILDDMLVAAACLVTISLQIARLIGQRVLSVTALLVIDSVVLFF